MLLNCHCFHVNVKAAVVDISPPVLLTQTTKACQAGLTANRQLSNCLQLEIMTRSAPTDLHALCTVVIYMKLKIAEAG